MRIKDHPDYVEYNSDYAPIMCDFATRRDAVRGMKALEAAGLDTVDKLIEAKPRLRQIMCEALPW